MLALSFLLLIGVFLIADGFGIKIDKAMIYGPMAFAILVEALNLMAAARKAKQDNTTQRPVALRPSYPDVDESVAIAAATSTSPDAGSVGLSRKPVAGEGGDTPAGLG